MSHFKLGDLVEFIPENFDNPPWPYRLIGHGYIEEISEDLGYTWYHIYCGKVVKQQMKNFVEIQLKDQNFEFNHLDMERLCKKINSK